jgi:GDP-mannose transporter
LLLAAVLKNLTNLFTLGGDYLMYGRTYKLNVWGCVLLMLLSAICGAATDLAFDARGYAWQILNCMFTAAYSLYMRGAMDRVAQHTSDGKKLGEFSMVRWTGCLGG